MSLCFVAVKARIEKDFGIMLTSDCMYHRPYCGKCNLKRLEMLAFRNLSWDNT